MAIQEPDNGDGRGFASALRLFLRDFAGFAGRRAGTAAVLVALGALVEGVGLLLLVPLLAIVTGSALPLGRFAAGVMAVFDLSRVTTPSGQLMLLLALFGILIILRSVVIYYRDLTVAQLQAGFSENLRLRVAQRLAAAPWEQVVRLRHARVTQVMASDIQRVGAVAFIFLRSVVAATVLIAQCALVFILTPALAALALLMLAAGAFFFVSVIRRSHHFGVKSGESNLSLLDSTSQFLGGLKLAISQNLQSGYLDKLRQNLHEQRDRQIAFVREQTNRQLAASMASGLAGGLLVLLGFDVFHVEPATLITLLLIVARMAGPAAVIQQGVQTLAQSLPVHTRVRSLEDELASIPPTRPVSAAARAPDGAIVFEDVSFHHPADDSDTGPARGVASVSLTINPGEFIGITGSSGAGKTTFADLLVGLFPAAQGRITVAGMALEGARLFAWRDCVSYISQDPFLFHDTIRRNLVWANSRADEADMWRALALAGADELVRRMEHGLETMVGERGTLVSGGERQRIAVARAILRKPRLLVLDEATSAIDVSGEREILARLHAMTPPPTIVIIAHRPESLALCDRILRFDSGRFTGEEKAPRG